MSFVVRTYPAAPGARLVSTPPELKNGTEPCALELERSAPVPPFATPRILEPTLLL